MKSFLAAFAVACALLAGSTNGWAKPVFTVLHTFTDANDGSPTGGLLPGRDGALYGVTQHAVFKLIPPVIGQTVWTYQVICRVEGAKGPLVADATGALYGTAFPDDSQSSWAFKLTPPSSPQSAWAYEVVHVFDETAQGENAVSPLAFDTNGQLYGTTRAGGASNVGTVFRLSPPVALNTPWTYALLYSFRGFQNHDGQNPSGPVTVRAVNGAVSLFGATYVGGTIAVAGASPNGDGTVFRLTAPVPGHTTWGYSVLHDFGAGQDGRYPGGNLIVHNDLTITGITIEGPRSGGTIYALTPRAPLQTGYTIKNLYEFGNRGDDTFTFSLFESLSKTLYGIQYGALGQPVIKLVPSVGTGLLTLDVLHQFPSQSPQGPLAAGRFVDGTLALYGVTLSGGSTNGTVYRLTFEP